MINTEVLDLTRHRPALERVLGATRYFQATAVVTIVVMVSTWLTLWFVSGPDQFANVIAFVGETLRSEPQTAFGVNAKVTAMLSLSFPVISILMAGALANFEEPVSFLFAIAMASLAFYFLWIFGQVRPVLEMMPAGFFYIFAVAAPLNFGVLALLFYGVWSLRQLPDQHRATLTDGFALRPTRTAFLRVLGLPSFILHLRWRRFIVVPLFALSSILLASSLYPFLFASSMAGNIYRINRATCLQELANRFQCLQQAMARDTLLLPVYVGIGFALSFGLYLAVRSLSRRISITSMNRLLGRDTRAPVLFLRPFDDDQVRFHKLERKSPYRLIRVGEEPRFLEHQVLEEMTELGPVIAIGNRGKQGVPYGAARDYLPDAIWKDRVGNLIDTSRAIILVLNDTPGVWWEVETVLEADHLDKTLFVFPWGSLTKNERLWGGLIEALAARGVAPPNCDPDAKTLMGLYRENGRWKLVLAHQPESIDTLALLRFFGHARLGTPSGSSRWFGRFPFSSALVMFVVFLFFADNIARGMTGADVIADALPEGWQLETVQGPSLDRDLDVDGYFEAVALNEEGQGALALMRRVRRSADLLWLDGTGGVAQTARVIVPERERTTAWDPRILPFALSLDLQSGTARAAQAILTDTWSRSEIQTFAADGTFLSRVEIAPRSDFLPSQTGIFLTNGDLLVRGAITGANGNEILGWGWIAPDGSLDRWRAAGSGVGRASAIEEAPDGRIGFAGVADKRWSVYSVDPQGQPLFLVGPPETPGFGIAAAIAWDSPDRWYVAGQIADEDNRDAVRRTVVAALSADGSYEWTQTYPDLQRYSVTDIHVLGDMILVTGTSGGWSNESTVILILDKNGTPLDRVTIAPSGTRSLRQSTVMEDESIWLFGLAKDIPENAGPLERSEYDARPWVAVLRRQNAVSEAN